MKAIKRPQDSARLSFHKLDLMDYDHLCKVFESHPTISSVIHFAGKKAVGESVKFPIMYYEINLASSLNLLKALDKYNVRHLLFSSTAALYGEPEVTPIPETSKLDPQSPYASTKIMIETFMKDLHNSAPDKWHFGALRYFNPCGAHPTGQIGEDPNGTPQNLMPYVSKVAGGKLPLLTVFGTDYPTKDGTAVRDYIHVVDLAKGHLKAMVKLAEKPQYFVYNLGSGEGTSVLEMIAAFEAACGHSFPVKMGARRPGDVPVLVADPAAAKRDLEWKSELTIQDMCRDLWNWQTKNPDGYKTV